MALPQNFNDMLENPTILGVCIGVAMFFGPIWVAFLFGVIIGWLWKPKWASLGKEKLTSTIAKSLDFCSSSASPSKSLLSSMKSYASSPCLNPIKMQASNPESLAVNKSLVVNKGMDKKASSSSSPMKSDNSSRYTEFACTINKRGKGRWRDKIQMLAYNFKFVICVTTFKFESLG